MIEPFVQNFGVTLRDRALQLRAGLGAFLFALLGVVSMGLSILYVQRVVVASGPSSNRVLNYQVRLADSAGNLVADGTYNVKISFYTVSTGGSPITSDCDADGVTSTYGGTPVARKVIVANGIGSVLIGDTAADGTHNCADGSAPNTLPASLFNNTALYLGITVAADAEMTPRKRIVAQGYALNADMLDDLDTSAIGGSVAFVPVTDSSGNLTLTKNFTVDTNTLFVDSTNDDVGIGTITPQHYGSGLYRTLEVMGKTTGSGGVIQSVSSDSSVKMRMFVDSGLGYVGTSTAHGLAIQAGGAERMRFFPSGNTGMGTGVTVPEVRFELFGNFRTTGKATAILPGSIDPTASTTVVGVGTGFTLNLIVGDRITVSGQTRTVTAIANDGLLTVDSAFSDNANDTSVDILYALETTRSSSSTTLNAVNDLGYVGIGTVAPNASLEVRGPTANYQLMVSASGANISKIMTVETTESTGPTQNGLLQLWSNATSKISLNAYSPGSSYFNAGNIGFGTTAPLTYVDIAGNFRSTGKSTATITGSINTTASTAVTGVGTLFTTELVVGDRITIDATTSETRTVIAIASSTSLTVDSAFSDQANDTSVSVLYALATRRLSSGVTTNVVNDLGWTGIGTTAPGSRLEVVGDILSKGTEWTARTSPADHNWATIVYGNGIFVAVGNIPAANPVRGTNLVMTSPDGINWTTRESGGDFDWRSLAYGNGMFVALQYVGSNVMTSPDGITWTLRSGAAPASQPWISVAYGNGRFVAVAYSCSSTTNCVMYSDDGVTWTGASSVNTSGWNNVAYGNGLFVAVSQTGAGDRIMTSPDGITWTGRTTSFAVSMTSTVYAKGLFVTVGSSVGGVLVMTSPDGINWTSRTAAAQNIWEEVTYGNGLFVAVARSGTGDRVMTSPDGINWISRASANDLNWNSVAYGNGMFAAIAYSGTGNRIMTSGAIDYAPFSANNTYQGGANIFGSVGIGLSSPIARLDLKGNLRTTGKATAVLTGSIDPAASTTVIGVGTLFTTEIVVGDRITVSGETRTVTAIASASSLTVDASFSNNANDTSPDVLYAIATMRDSANSTLFAVNDLGYTGIGTVSPALVLHTVVQQPSATNGPNANSFSAARFMVQTAGGGPERGIELGAPTSAISDAPVYVKVQGSSNRFGILNEDNLERLSISSFGNVGIGNTSPAARLDVVGGLRITGRTAELSGDIDPTASTTVTGVNTRFPTELVIGDRITVSGETRTVTAIASNTSLTVDTAFTDNGNDTTPDGVYALMNMRDSSGSIKLTMNDLGNIGIGTILPTTELQVSGTTDVFRIADPTASSYVSQELEVGGSVKGRIYGFGASYASSGRLVANSMLIDSTAAGGLGISAAATAPINFYTSTAQRMIIESGGNVGIGDATPASLFTVGSGDMFRVDGSGNVTTLGDVTVEGGDLVTTQATFNLVAGASTVNIAGGSGSTGCTVDSSGNLACTGTVSGSGASFSGHLLPSADDTYDLGSAGFRWRDLYLGPTTLHIASTAGETTTSRDWKLSIQETNGATEGNLRILEGASEFVNITPGGNFGIGTTLPLTRLDIAGNTRTTGKATALITGSIDTSASTAVTGVGTAFTTELVVGDRITVDATSSETRTVTAIASATSLTVDTAFSDQANDTTVNVLYALATMRDSSNAVKFAVSDLGYLGIGTAAPSFPITIDLGGSTGGLKIENGTQPRIDFNTTTGGAVNWDILNEGNLNRFSIRQIGNGNAIFAITGGAPSDSLIIASSGNVGLGDATADARLDIESSAAADGILIDNTAATGDSIVGFQLSGTSQFTLGVDDSTTNDNFVISDGSALGTLDRLTIDGSTGAMSVAQNFTVDSGTLFVDSSANTVSINSLTPVAGSAPGLLTLTESAGTNIPIVVHASHAIGAEFYTHSNTGFRAPAISLLRSEGTATVPTTLTIAERLGYIGFGGYDGSGYFGGSEISSSSSGAWNGTSHGTDLYFSTTANGTTSLLERLRVANNGNIGINTTSPVSRLDLFGNFRTAGKATGVLTGSIDPAASTAVTGVATLFTTELVVGDRITVTGETRTVTAIASATSLTVDTAFSNNANDTSPDALYAIVTMRDSANAMKFAVNDLGNVGVNQVATNDRFTVMNAEVSNRDTGPNVMALRSATGIRAYWGYDGAAFRQRMFGPNETAYGQIEVNNTSLVLAAPVAMSLSAPTGNFQVQANDFFIETSSIERFHIDPAGNVGVGDATPTALFTVGSGDQLRVDASGNLSTNGDIAIDGGDLTTTAATATLFNTNATTISVAGAATTLNLGPTNATNTVYNFGTGTGTSTLNIGTGGTGIKTIAIGGSADNVITIANTQTAGSIAMGTTMIGGTISIGGTGAQTGALTIGPGTSTGSINIGNSSGTGNILLGGSTGARSIRVGGTGANDIDIGNTQTGGSIEMGMAMTTGFIQIGSIGAQTGGIYIGGGTSSSTLDIGNGPGTGSLSIGGVGAKITTIQTGTTGTITIGGANQTGAITLGSSSGSNNINIGNGAGTSNVNISNNNTGGTVSIGASLTGSITFGGGSGSTGCTITGSTGALACDGTTTFSGLTANRAVFSNAASQLATTGASADLLNSLTDETGTGVVVFGTTPTFTTNITSPILIGGTSSTSTLSLRSTSGSGTTGADIIFQTGTNGATEAMRILNSGNVGIGTTPTTTDRLKVAYSDSGTGLIYGSSSYTTSANTGGVRLSAFGSHSNAAHTAGGTVTNLIGAQGGAEQAGAGPITNAVGLRGYVSSTGSGNITKAYGVKTAIANDGSSVMTDAYSMYAESASVSSGSITNSYGLYLESQTAGATLNYSIYSAGGQSYHAGNLGVGDATPASLFTVGNGDKFQVDSNGNLSWNTTGTTVDFASGTNGNTFTMKIPQQATTIACSSGTAEGLIFKDTGGTQRGHLCIDGPTSATPNKLRFFAEAFTATSTDLAEMYSTHEKENVEAGDVVALDPAGNLMVVKTTAPNSSKIFGVVSTSPGLALSGIDEATGESETVNGRYVALKGRVPVKVSAENGPILPGDRLTSSSVAGVAMRATGAGNVIGRALDAWSGSTEQTTVRVFMEVGYWNGIEDGVANPLADLIGPSSIDANGTFVVLLIDAKKVVSEEFAVRRNDERKSIGSAKLSSGKSFAQVHDGSISAGSKVFFSFRKNPGSYGWVDEIADGFFVIKVAQPTVEDVDFDYWVVSVVDETNVAPVVEPEIVPEVVLEPTPELEVDPETVTEPSVVDELVQVEVVAE